MSDNKLKTGQAVAEAAKAVEPIETIETIEPIETTDNETLKHALTEMTSDGMPINDGGAERILELYQKVLDSNLPDEDKGNLTMDLEVRWVKILEDIAEKAVSENNQPRLSVGYILQQIELIRSDNEHVLNALSSLENLVIDDGVGDIANQARSEAIGNVVKCRETTNQRLIAFYEKLYGDIKSEPVDFNHFSLQEIVYAIERCDAGEMSGETSKALKSALIGRLRAADINDSYKTKFEALSDLISAHTEPTITDLRSLVQSFKKG